ncbi:MAG: BrnT family toxin [Bacilli bacterium]
MVFGEIIITLTQEEHMMQAHQVTAEEILEALEDPHFHVQLLGTDTRPGKLYYGYGRAANGRLLTVTLRVFPDGNVFVITGRDMSARDKRKYRGR